VRHDGAAAAGRERVSAAGDPGSVVRRLYQAWAEGDLDGAGECFAPDAVWRVPGRSAIAGCHRGWDGIRDFFGTLSRLSGGTFRADLVDVAVGERHVVAVQHATAEREGRRLDVTACQLMTLEGGRITRVHAHYGDQEALDAFWSAPEEDVRPSPA
jgi:ketosteroid isomerase-like protein